MAHGILVRLSTQDGSDLTVEAVTSAAAEQGQRLTELESTKFVPGAVLAAKALIDSIGVGPFFVTVNAADSFGVHGDVTFVTVSVDSAATELPSDEPITEGTSSSTEVNEQTAGPSVPGAPGVTGDEAASVEATPEKVDGAETSAPSQSEEGTDGETVSE